MSCYSSRSIFNVIGYANIDTIGSWLKECLRGNASISHGKEDMEVSNGDTLIRASLLALAGSRRAALLGLEGFCLCHLGREVVGNDPLWPNCGADCCQFVVILAASFIARWPLATLFLYPYIPPTAASSVPSLRGKY